MKTIAIGLLAAMWCWSSPAPADDGKAVLERACAKCHALGVVLGERNDRDRWSAIVDDMVMRGAEMSDAEIEKVIDYLVKTQGPKVNVNKATAQELSRALDVPLPAAAAVVEYRAAHGSFKALDDLKKVPALKGKELDSKKDDLEFSDK
jgi:competence protein ComEA